MVLKNIDDDGSSEDLFISDYINQQSNFIQNNFMHIQKYFDS